MTVEWKRRPDACGEPGCDYVPAEVRDSDGDAQAVCEAIRQHLAHGGKLPWPSIRNPYEAWAARQ